MAYSEKQLTTEWMPQVRWPNGDNVNLVTVREAIQEQADENGIPVAFSEDQLKVGGLFSSEREDILIMYNPQHQSDYRTWTQCQSTGLSELLTTLRLGFRMGWRFQA